MKKKKPPHKRCRNWLAVHAHNRKAGPMPDRKKKQNKKACRGKESSEPNEPND